MRSRQSAANLNPLSTVLVLEQLGQQRMLIAKSQLILGLLALSLHNLPYSTLTVSTWDFS